MGGSRWTLPVGTSGCKIRHVNESYKLADRTQQLGSLHGDGFYPLGGSTTIDTVTKSNTAWNGEVIEDTGRNILVRDFVAWIDGVEVGDKNKRQFTPASTSSYTVTGSGTVYITLEPRRFSGPDGFDRPDYDRGVVGEATSAPARDSGKILVAVLTDVPASGNLFPATTIDNSVRDYMDLTETMREDINSAYGLSDTNATAIANLEGRVTTLEGQTVSTGPLAQQHKVVDADIASGTYAGTLANSDIQLVLGGGGGGQILIDAFPGPVLDTGKWPDPVLGSVVVNGTLTPTFLAPPFDFKGSIANTVISMLDGTYEFDFQWLQLGNPFDPKVSMVVGLRVTGHGPRGDEADGITDGYAIRMNVWDNPLFGTGRIEFIVSKRVGGITVVQQNLGFSTIPGGFPIPPPTPVSYAPGVNHHVKVSINGNLIAFEINGTTLSAIFLDLTPLPAGGVSMGLTSGFIPGAIWVDNVDVNSLAAATYVSPSIITTDTLIALTDVRKAFASIESDTPTNTSVTMELSLDGGINWVTKTDLELLDGTAAPFNGTGDDVKTRVTLATTDPTKTPTFKALKVAASTEIHGDEFLPAKAKINEIIDRHNAGTLNQAPTIANL